MKINERFLFINIVLLTKVQLTWPCAATTTTPAPTTTTVNPCATCSLSTITLTPGDGGVTTTTPTTTGIRADANGCSVITVTCTANAGGMTFMQFNVNQGGPLQPIGTIVMADLNCINGQWNFVPGMGLPSRIITEVNCVNA